MVDAPIEDADADAVDQFCIQAALEKVLTGQHLAVQCHVDRSEANNLLQRLCDRSGVFTTDKDNAGTLSRPHVRWFDADALVAEKCRGADEGAETIAEDRDAGVNQAEEPKTCWVFYSVCLCVPLRISKGEEFGKVIDAGAVVFEFNARALAGGLGHY